MDLERIAERISAPRLKPFLDASGGDLAAALDLYEWHAKLSAACFHSMHHVEVLLRNAIDEQLGRGHPDEPLTQMWLMDFAVLRPDAVKLVITAVERVGKGKQITRGRVIAALSFAFWSGLFGGQYEELWRQQLRHAFPGAKERKDLSVRLAALRRFRNRLAHHDSILSQPVKDRLDQMIQVVGYIDVGAAQWVADSSGASRLLSERPGVA